MYYEDYNDYSFDVNTLGIQSRMPTELLLLFGSQKKYCTHCVKYNKLNQTLSLA